MGKESQAEKRALAYRLFDRLMDLPAVEQRQYLRENCDDREVREWVIDLIAADSTDGGLLDSDLMPAVGLDHPPEPPAALSPEEIAARTGTGLQAATRILARTPDRSPPKPESEAEAGFEAEADRPDPATPPPDRRTSSYQHTAIRPGQAVPSGTDNAGPKPQAPGHEALAAMRRHWLPLLLGTMLVAVTSLALMQWLELSELRGQVTSLDADKHRAEADAAIALHGQAVALYRQRDYAEARLRFAQAIQLGETAWGPGHVNLGVFRSNHANNLLGLEQLDAAEVEFVTAIDILQENYGSDSTQVADARMGYGELLLRQQAWAAAEREFRQVLDNRRDNPQVARWRSGVSAIRLGECLARLGRRDDARRIIEAGMADLRTGPEDRVEGEVSRARRLLRELGA